MTMKKWYMTCCLLTAMTLAWAQGPNNTGTYYKNADGERGEALKTALSAIITKGHTKIGYDGLYNAYKKTDSRPDGKVRDWYSNATNYTHVTDKAGSYKKEGDCYNREHSLPQSWFEGGGNADYLKCDIVHVLPTDGYINNQRSNNVLANVNPNRISGQSKNGYSKWGQCGVSGYSGTVFEPNDDIKGDMARIYFYVVTRYESNCTKWASNATANAVFTSSSSYQPFKDWYYKMLVEWSQNDPVDELEIARNNAVHREQGNRNPFVDYPGLEEYIWGDKKNEPFDYDDYNATVAVRMPTFSPDGGTYTSPQSVTISCATDGATIYYTIDGSTPGANNHAGYGTTEVNVAVTQSMTIKAVAVKNGVSSEVASATYTVDVPVVESNDFSLATSNDDLVAGTKLVVAYNQSGYLMSTTKSGTSNGFIETTSGFEFSADKSTVTLEDGCNAMVLTLGGEEGAWTLTDESGKYFTMAANAVTTTLEDESTVYYTIDISSDGGATIKPSGSGVTRMLRMNQLTSNGRFASYAQATGGLVQIYVQEGAGGVTTVKDPVFSRTSGSTFNTASTNVTITTGTSGATVYYTVNGTTPSATNYAGSGLKTVTLTVTQSVTVKAIAIKDGVSSNVVTATYTVDTSGDSNMNRNSRSSYYNASKKMWNLEWPRIKDDDNQSWVIKEAGGYTTYALEWDNSKIANRYTCYQMFDNNWDGSASRKDNFIEDPDLPSATRSKQSDYSSSGFSRGHLCPSADRTLTQTQNDQTFYFSNMQPQYQNHNGGQWSTYEAKVRTWAAQFDTLYVVKAATIDNITLNNSTQSGVFNFTCNDRLPVAKYFYMALMGYKKSTNTYTAVGIWTYHYNSTSERKTAEHITIDELERRTGIDFFCNLPDDVEEEMESKAVDSSIWGSPQ